MRMILQIIISNGILDLVTGILAKISLGTGIWAKFRLGTGIWYPPSRPSENVRQLFQVLRVIQYQEFIVIYRSHPLTVRIVKR